MTFIDELTHLGQAGHLGGTSLDGEPGTPERALAEAQLKNSEAEAKLSKATAHLESAKATKAKADAEAEEKKGGPDPQNIERRSKDKQKRLEQMKPLKDKLKVMDEKLRKVKDKGELRRAALPYLMMNSLLLSAVHRSHSTAQLVLMNSLLLSAVHRSALPAVHHSTAQTPLPPPSLSVTAARAAENAANKEFKGHKSALDKELKTKEKQALDPHRAAEVGRGQSARGAEGNAGQEAGDRRGDAQGTTLRYARTHRAHRTHRTHVQNEPGGESSSKCCSSLTPRTVRPCLRSFLLVLFLSLR